MVHSAHLTAYSWYLTARKRFFATHVKRPSMAVQQTDVPSASDRALISGVSTKNPTFSKKMSRFTRSAHLLSLPCTIPSTTFCPNNANSRAEFVNRGTNERTRQDAVLFRELVVVYVNCMYEILEHSLVARMKLLYFRGNQPCIRMNSTQCTIP